MGLVLTTAADSIGRITLSNPDKYNAMSLSMWRALVEAVRGFDTDPQVRVVLLEGAGDKAFVSGADISEFETLRDSEQAVQAYEEAVDLAQIALMECSKPVVARIQGVCMGGGIDLALACDLRFSNRDARFRMPAARLGLGYAYRGLRNIVNLLGAARTADIFYTARTFDGREAERLGLVHSALANEELGPAVEQVLREIAANAPLTLRAVKLGIRAVSADGAEQHELVRQTDAAVRACFASADYREGRRAFVEKRPPPFTGA